MVNSFVLFRGEMAVKQESSSRLVYWEDGIADNR